MRLPTYFIPHGGGPCFFMDWDPKNTWDSMAAWLRSWPTTLPEKPKALLIISGHWEEQDITISANPAPSLIYDYSGFPHHTYELTWPAPGDSALAKRTQDLLLHAGIVTALDPDRGFDHGVFVPLKVAFPDADIPTIQVSLRKGLDPETHLKIGKALAPLRDEGVLIIGSGMSYHNMRGYNWDNERIPHTEPFDHWLTKAISKKDHISRNALFAEWSKAPGARNAHPREEHLLPLMVAAGAAMEDTGKLVFHDYVLGAPIGAYQFG